jgi:hypothetical protein
LLDVTPRYIRKLINVGHLAAIRLPNASGSGRHELGRLRIPREAAALLAESLGQRKRE